MTSQFSSQLSQGLITKKLNFYVNIGFIIQFFIN